MTPRDLQTVKESKKFHLYSSIFSVTKQSEKKKTAKESSGGFFSLYLLLYAALEDEIECLKKQLRREYSLEIEFGEKNEKQEHLCLRREWKKRIQQVTFWLTFQTFNKIK